MDLTVAEFSHHFCPLSTFNPFPISVGARMSSYFTSPYLLPSSYKITFPLVFANSVILLLLGGAVSNLSTILSLNHKRLPHWPWMARSLVVNVPAVNHLTHTLKEFHDEASSLERLWLTLSHTWYSLILPHTRFSSPWAKTTFLQWCTCSCQ